MAEERVADYPGPPVYVSGGNNPTVTPDPVGISTSATLCQFVNQDPTTNYIIELWISSNSVRVPLAVVLPAGGRTALILDPAAAPNGTINYNILVQGTSSAPSRGGHGIIVGSGIELASKETAA